MDKSHICSVCSSLNPAVFHNCSIYLCLMISWGLSTWYPTDGISWYHHVVIWDFILIFPYIYPISHSSPILSLLSYYLPISYPIIFPDFYPFPIEISSQKNGSGIYHINIPTFPYLWCIPYFSHTFPRFFPFLFDLYFMYNSSHISTILSSHIYPFLLSIWYIYHMSYPLSIIYYLIHYLLYLPYIFHMFSIYIW